MHTFTHTSTNTHTHRHTHTWTYTHMHTPCTYAYIQAHTVRTNQMALSCYVCWHFVPSSFWWTSSLGPSLSESWTFLQAPTCEHQLEKKEKQNKKTVRFQLSVLYNKKSKTYNHIKNRKICFFFLFFFLSSSDFDQWSDWSKSSKLISIYEKALLRLFSYLKDFA